jgi:transcriptional regulator with XRE-family HTH domain
VKSNESEQNTPRTVFSSQVRRARKARGWTQQALVDRLAEIGYTDQQGVPRIARATLAKIEDGNSTRSNASLEDVLALAAALDVSPMHLLAPHDDREALRVTDGLPPVPASLARRWIRGEAHLRFLLGIGNSREDLQSFLAAMPESEFRVSAAAMGLNKNQIAEAMSGIRSGTPPWPGGRPLEPDEAERQTQIETLERLLAHLKKEGSDDAN